MKLKSPIAKAVILASITLSGNAFADAIIFNTGVESTATVALGVKDYGQLNTSLGNIADNADATGLAAKFSDGTWQDATSPGCLCEGWGVAANDLGASANVASGGVTGLSLTSFSSTGSTATSVVTMTSLPGLEVTHAFQTSASADLFEAVVTIKNTTGATATDVRYTRAMDWDIPTDEFNEYVTIQGTATTSTLLYSSDDGFASTNPFASRSDLNGCGVTTDFVDCGPDDHGAIFDFGFGDLADGEELTFSIFYGAADSELDALDALSLVGPELFSLGQESGDPVGGTPKTYIFAFSGVGGSVIIPPKDVPEPSVIALIGLGLAGMGAVSRRRRKA